jgi:hypothetical protein
LKTSQKGGDMKTLFIGILFFIITIPTAFAVDTTLYTSEPDSIFCQTYSDIQALERYMQQGDKIAVAKLFDTGICAIVKPSLDLYIEETKGDKVRIRRRGMTQTLWTFRKFLR